MRRRSARRGRIRHHSRHSRHAAAAEPHRIGIKTARRRRSINYPRRRRGGHLLLRRRSARRRRIRRHARRRRSADDVSIPAAKPRRFGIKTARRRRRRYRRSARRRELLGGDFGHLVVENRLIGHRRTIRPDRRNRPHVDAAQVGIRRMLRHLQRRRVEPRHALPRHRRRHRAISAHAALRHRSPRRRRRIDLRRRADRSIFVDKVDVDIAETQLVARLYFLLTDADVVDIRPVGTLQIAKKITPVLIDDLRMIPRQRLCRNEHGVSRIAANRHFRLTGVHVDVKCLIIFIAIDDSGHFNLTPIRGLSPRLTKKAHIRRQDTRPISRFAPVSKHLLMRAHSRFPLARRTKISLNHFGCGQTAGAAIDPRKRRRISVWTQPLHLTPSRAFFDALARIL